jgi:hypothetical protein
MAGNWVVIWTSTLDDTGKPAGGPLNRRAEMWSNMKNALQEGRLSIPTTMPCMPT